MSNYKNFIGAIDAAASTAKSITASPQMPALLGAIALSSPQRGRITRLNVSGADLMGTNSSAPISMFSADSASWECNYAATVLNLGTGAFDLAVTLDANGQLSFRGFLDPIPPELLAKIQANPGQIQTDQNFILGMGETTVGAATQNVTLTAQTKRRTRGWFRLIIDVLGTPALNDVVVTSVNIGGDETNNQPASPVSAVDFAANNNAKLGGLFWIDLGAGQPISIVTNVNAAGGATIGAGFLRAPNMGNNGPRS